MIELNDITLGYENRLLLNGANAEFDCGKLTALIGRNGTGKSTLLRAIAGLNNNYSGNITIGGRVILAMEPQQKARTLALVTTSRTRVPNLCCRDIVALGRAPYTNWIGHMQQRDYDKVISSLEAVGMASYAERTMNTMSDGECQRIMIARALAQETPVILLDEPTSFLDMPGRYELVMLLKRLSHENNKCIIFSTHELDLASNHCDTIALITDGQLIHLPTPRMIESGNITRAFNIPR